jgi:hypothetical protein
MPSRHPLPLPIVAVLALGFGTEPSVLRPQVGVDAHSVVTKLRALRDQASTDATLRLLITARGEARVVRTVRLRARAFNDEFKTLVEVRDASSLQGRVLIVQTGPDVHVESWHRQEPAADPSGDGDTGMGWLSPCVRAEDFADAHLWWPVQSVIRQERVGDRDALVLESRRRPATSAPQVVFTDWIDAVRLVPLRTEQLSAAGTLVASVIYDRIRRREGCWTPARVVIARPERGCRVEMTALSGTTRASVPAAVFDPGRLAEVR